MGLRSGVGTCGRLELRELDRVQEVLAAVIIGGGMHCRGGSDGGGGTEVQQELRLGGLLCWLRTMWLLMLRMMTVVVL